MTGPLGFFRRLRLIPQGIVIILTGFLPVFAIVSMFPAVPSLIQHFAGDDTARWKVPMMVSAPGLSIALLAPFAGIAVDRFGRRKLLLWATALYALAGMAPLVLTTLNQIFVSRLFVGVAEAAILTITNTLIGDYWRDEGRRDWLFLQGIVAPFCSTLALLAVGAVVATRWNAVFLVYAVTIPIFVAMALFVFEPTRDGETAAEHAVHDAPTPFPWRTVAGVCAVTLFASILYYVFIINGGLAWQEVGVTSPDAIGKITAIPTLFILLGALFFRLLSGQPNTIQIGAPFLFLGLGLAGIGLAPTPGWMAMGLVVQQIGAGMTVVTLIAWISGKLPFEHRGRGMGAWSSCFFLGQFISPAIVHQFNNLTGTMQGAFLIAGCLGVAAFVAALLLHFTHRTPTLTSSEQPA